MNKIVPLVLLIACFLNIELFAQRFFVDTTYKKQDTIKNNKTEQTQKNIINKKHEKQIFNYNNKFIIGANVGMGICDPKDVNEYLKNKYYHYNFEYGSSDIYTNLIMGINFSYRINKNLEVRSMFELGWAPKFITYNNSPSESYHFVRYSPGIGIVFHLPIKRNSLFAGATLMYHSLSFEDYKASNLGYRIDMGFNLNVGRFSPKFFIGYDFASATDKRQVSEYDELYYKKSNFELNFSSVIFGTCLCFYLN